jgi:hypothetical protein
LSILPKKAALLPQKAILFAPLFYNWLEIMQDNAILLTERSQQPRIDVRAMLVGSGDVSGDAI